MPHTGGNWTKGKNYGAVVSDIDPTEFGQGHEDVEAYGGVLIAESITAQNAPIIAAAPKLLDALVKLQKAAGSFTHHGGGDLSQLLDALGDAHRAITLATTEAEPLRPKPIDHAWAVMSDVATEVRRAKMLWPTFNSAHEGYAVILEELEEVKTHVFMKQSLRDLQLMRDEAVQLAAMAVRFAAEVCDETRGRK